MTKNQVEVITSVKRRGGSRGRKRSGSLRRRSSRARSLPNWRDPIPWYSLLSQSGPLVVDLE
jgi:hypothetical protein